MQKKDLPIGFFDSGIGGLSVLKYATEQMPNEHFIYYGDNANAPYGTKQEGEIQELSLGCGEFLYNKGVKAIVMACNTATSAAVYMMRDKYRIPVVSIEPAVKPAVEACGDGKILVLATPATITQERYHQLIKRLGCTDRVINMPCPGLVELIETGDFSSPEIDRYIADKFEGLKGQLISGIVMGCTHYSFISDKIKKIADEMLAGDKVIYDGMYGTVRHLRHVLEENGLINDGGGPRTVEYYSSANGGTLELFRKIMER